MCARERNIESARFTLDLFRSGWFDLNLKIFVHLAWECSSYEKESDGTRDRDERGSSLYWQLDDCAGAYILRDCTRCTVHRCSCVVVIVAVQPFFSLSGTTLPDGFVLFSFCTTYISLVIDGAVFFFANSSMSASIERTRIS